MRKHDIKTIIFDYDGTLHDSFIIYKQAFLKAFTYLVDQKKLPYRRWYDQEIKAFLGKNPQDMWVSFKPRLDEETINIASNIITSSMVSQIENHQAKLYDGALDVLSYLKQKGYHLIFLSNSKTIYKNMHVNMFLLQQYFDQIICSEDYDYISKIDIVSKILGELKKDIAVVGDRIYDMEIGTHYGFLTVACDYGYGTKDELIQADYHISDIKQILDIF